MSTEKLTKEDLDEMSFEEIKELVENVEQLDELSKKTLGSYIRSAHYSGIKASAEQAKAPTSSKEWDKAFNKSYNRRMGIRKAVARLTKEEVEQLDELSKKTLKSYTKKATTSSERTWNKADREEDNAMATDGIKKPEKQKRHMDNAGKHIATWNKRESGLKMAKKKLSEEIDIISLVEEKDIVTFKDVIKSILEDKAAARFEQNDFDLLGEEEEEEFDIEDIIDYIEGIDEDEFSEMDEDVQDAVLEYLEEGELNELSKKTLGSYIGKAANDMAMKHADRVVAQNDYDHAGSVSNGLGTNTSRRVRDQAADMLRKDAQERQSKAFRGVAKRMGGIAHATAKLTK